MMEVSPASQAILGTFGPAAVTVFILTALVFLMVFSVHVIRRSRPGTPLAPLLAAHGLLLSLCSVRLLGALGGGSEAGASLESAPFVQAWTALGRTESVAVQASGPCAGVFRVLPEQGSLERARLEQQSQARLPASCEAALALRSEVPAAKPER